MRGALHLPNASNCCRPTRGAVRVWCYAPGYFENGQVSPDAMRRLTGFELKQVIPQQALATPTEAGKKIGRA